MLYHFSFEAFIQNRESRYYRPDSGRYFLQKNSKFINIVTDVVGKIFKKELPTVKKDYIRATIRRLFRPLILGLLRF